MTSDERSNILQQLYHLQGSALALNVACRVAQAVDVGLAAASVLETVNEQIDGMTGKIEVPAMSEFPRRKF